MNKNSKKSNTPYDDIFRTLLVEGRELILPLINETFGENYNDNAEIIFNQNEHFINGENGGQKEIITDSNFMIIYNGITKYYHYECQSYPDSTIIIRMFEYETKIALENSTVEGNVMTVNFPNAAVLYLRSTSKTPDKMKVVIKVPEPGKDGEYYINVVKVIKYSIDDIFEKKLWFLIPFYIFSYEKVLEKYENSEEEREKLINEYIKIKDRLEGLARKKIISDFQKIMIIDMSKKAVDNMAEKFSAVKEGVKKVMGGQVLDFEAKYIRDEGRREGRREGIEEGRIEGISEGKHKNAVSNAITMLKDGLGVEKTSLYSSLPIDEVIALSKDIGTLSV